MNLWRAHAIRFGRWLRTVGWFMPVVILFAAGIATLVCAASGPWPVWTALSVIALTVMFHLRRGDLRLLRSLLRHPRMHVAAEYLLAGLVPAALLLLRGHPFHAAAILPAEALVACIPQRRTSPAPPVRLRIHWLGLSPEWTAGIRRHPAITGLTWVGAAICALAPYAGYIALCLAALFCTELYARNEPLQLLLLPERSGAQLLGRKIRTAWRNYFLAAAPIAAAAACLHPEAIWLAAVWVPFAAMVLLYSVLAKYSFYDPSDPAGSVPAIARAGLMGFLIPPLLPVTLCLLVSYALRAERNLNLYLHDYDRHP